MGRQRKSPYTIAGAAWRVNAQLVCGVYFTSAAMPHRLCSICQVQGRFLEHISRDALVEYYRCDACGHVWTHEKANPNSPPEPITVKAEKAAPIAVIGHANRQSEIQAAGDEAGRLSARSSADTFPMSEFTREQILSLLQRAPDAIRQSQEIRGELEAVMKRIEETRDSGEDAEDRKNAANRTTGK
jgi:hypothetical protein